ncbi:MAG: pilus assembly protein TadE [Nitrospira sp.]|nr:pilus assembly protein TadE [Nitrospira sp.]
MKKLNQRGAVAAEFALLLPVLLTILFGIMEFGMIMYGREVVTNATREGARAGIVQSTPPVSAGAIEAIATNYLTGTGVSTGSVDFDVPASGGGTGTPVTVTATYSYPWLIPYIPTLLGLPSPLPIPITVTMLHE